MYPWSSQAPGSLEWVLPGPPPPGPWSLAWDQAGAASELPTEPSAHTASPGKQSSYEIPRVACRPWTAPSLSFGANCTK